jgi:hypothetical protein
MEERDEPRQLVIVGPKDSPPTSADDDACVISASNLISRNSKTEGKSVENAEKLLTRGEIKINKFMTAGASATEISQLGLRYRREELLPI